MKRRDLLRGGAALTGALPIAGCSRLIETRAVGIPPVPEDRPDGIYYPSHLEEMAVVDTTTQGDYGLGLLYSYPHRFWTVTGDDVSLTDIEESDAVHLMASVWDRETGTVLPETGLSVAISRDGALVSQEVIYPMLSQPMGFHYGANFGLDGDGRYTVELSVGGVTTRRTGAFANRFADPATVEMPFEYSEAAKTDLGIERFDERVATSGAVEPMSMNGIPDAFAPRESALPGRILGTATSDGVRLVTTVLDEPPAGVESDGSYLAVSARTHYNRMVVPAMGLDGRLDRDGETVFEGPFTRTLDPDLGYHYGAAVDGVETGDDLTLSVAVQPQTARHEGYETALGGLKGGMPDVRIDVQ